jgi:Raf kinase inhibitor-like YbhB/YbcL family protein
VRWLIVPAAAVLGASMLMALAGCGARGGTTRSAARSAPSTLELSSSAFPNGSSIPSRYTCDGQDTPPPLAWSAVPPGARSLALLAEDANAPGGAFVHFSLYDLPAGSRGIRGARLAAGSAEGRNSFGRIGYGGPCPPKGDPAHHYVFSIHALDDYPGLPRGASPAAVRQAIAGHSIAAGTLTGTYRR